MTSGELGCCVLAIASSLFVPACQESQPRVTERVVLKTPPVRAEVVDPEHAPEAYAPAARHETPHGERPVAPGATECAPITGDPGCAIELLDPSRRALRPLEVALARARSGGRARLAFFGASHTASDIYVNEIRRRLQRTHGDGGHGFVFPVAPYRGYRHLNVEVATPSGEWVGHRATNAGGSEVFGYGGAYTESSEAGAQATLRIDGPLRIEVAVARTEGGGAVELLIDGAARARIETAGAGIAFEALNVDAGSHDVTLSVVGNGPVRLLGVSLERPSGVIVDTLGLNGARVRQLLSWEEGAFSSILRHYAPDVVVLAYGTNEAGQTNLSLDGYERDLDEVVARLRAALPASACVLVGPSDRAERKEIDGVEVIEPLALVQAVADAQYRVAVTHGCAFFDLSRFVGPPGTIATWADRAPPFAQPDLVHFTRAGYRRLGEVLGDALLRGIE